MKELLQKKSVKIALVIIVLLVVMGIVGINVRSAQMSKEYNAHMDAAEKYLTDLDYEQAIAEYTMAFEIEPKEEVVDALEQTYLAYAQTCIDAGDYEKAVGILEEGYEKIGRESLQNKIAEVTALQAQKQLEEEQRRIEEEQRASGMVEFPFQMTDITVMGYDLSEDYFEQIQRSFPAEGGGYWVRNGESGYSDAYREGEGVTSDGWRYAITARYSDERVESRWLSVNNTGGSWSYIVSYEDQVGGPHVQLDIFGDVFYYAGINVPVAAGETYEDWCRVMQIDRMKENDLRPEERDGMVGIWREDGYSLLAVSTGEGCEYWLFSSEGHQGIYSEFDGGNGDRFCILYFVNLWSGEDWPIASIKAEIGADGVIKSIDYRGW